MKIATNQSHLYKSSGNKLEGGVGDIVSLQAPYFNVSLFYMSFNNVSLFSAEGEVQM